MEGGAKTKPARPYVIFFFAQLNVMSNSIVDLISEDSKFEFDNFENTGASSSTEKSNDSDINIFCNAAMWCRKPIFFQNNSCEEKSKCEFDTNSFDDEE